LDLASLAGQLTKLAGVNRCDVAGPSVLDIWAETVSEPGKAAQVSILGKTVYVKDAPILILRKVGFETQRGDDTNLAANFLVAHGWPEWEEMRGGRYVDDSETARLYRRGQELRRRFLEGHVGLLPDMLANVQKLWDSYYATYPPQIGNSRLLAEFLRTNPGVAHEYVRWYVARGYGHGAPHCFCWRRGTDVWFWANGGGEKYKPKSWMEDFKEGLRPEIHFLRFRPSKQTVLSVEGTPHAELGEALVARDINWVQKLVDRYGRRVFFVLPDVATQNYPEGCLLGRHYTQWVEVVTRLRQIGRDDAAEILLLALLPVIERSEQGEVLPPWYYDQLCIIYRKSKRFEKEIEIIQRLMKLRPRDPWLVDQLAAAHSRLRKRDRA